MKSISSVLVTIFAFIGIVSTESTATESGSENDNWKYNMPSFFKRTYKEWSRNNTCNYERMKSLALELNTLRSHRHRLTTQMAQGGFPLKKAELRIEFYGISNKMAMQNKTYFADIDPIDISLDLSPIKSSSLYIDEELVELTFDVTELYNATKKKGLNVLKFKLKLLRPNRRTAKALSRTTIKAFIIVYEKLKSCGFQDAFRRNARAKRSLDINLEKDNVPERNSTVGLDINEEEHCHKKDTFVTFVEKGMDFVIHPSYYRTSDCVLDLALSHTFMQTDLSKSKRRGGFVCCVPTDFESLTMVFEDISNDGRPVMSKFNDMAAKRCGCQLI